MDTIINDTGNTIEVTMVSPIFASSDDIGITTFIEQWGGGVKSHVDSTIVITFPASMDCSHIISRYERIELMCSTEVRWAQVRSVRDKLISATDYLMMSDYPLTDDQKTEIITYRHALRDIPETYSSSPDSVVWPEPPAFLNT